MAGAKDGRGRKKKVFRKKEDAKFDEARLNEYQIKESLNRSAKLRATLSER